MKVLKWNIDKEKGTFGCKINKAISNRVVSYETLYGEKISLKSSEIRKKPKFKVCNGHVIGLVDL